MYKSYNAELSRTINQQAHILAVQSFAAIHMRLVAKVRVLLKVGKSMDETLRVIRIISTHMACIGYGPSMPNIVTAWLHMREGLD
jgi:hypothetical protein